MSKSESKIGSGHASAMGRQGLARAASGSISGVQPWRSPAEYGTYGTKTPGEVAEDRRGDEHAADKDVQGSFARSGCA